MKEPYSDKIFHIEELENLSVKLTDPLKIQCSHAVVELKALGACVCDKPRLFYAFKHWEKIFDIHLRLNFVYLASIYLKIHKDIPDEVPRAIATDYFSSFGSYMFHIDLLTDKLLEGKREKDDSWIFDDLEELINREPRSYNRKANELRKNIAKNNFEAIDEEQLAKFITNVFESIKKSHLSAGNFLCSEHPSAEDYFFREKELPHYSHMKCWIKTDSGRVAVPLYLLCGSGDGDFLLIKGKSLFSVKNGIRVISNAFPAQEEYCQDKFLLKAGSDWLDAWRIEKGRNTVVSGDRRGYLVEYRGKGDFLIAEEALSVMMKRFRNNSPRLIDRVTNYHRNEYYHIFERRNGISISRLIKDITFYKKKTYFHWIRKFHFAFFLLMLSLLLAFTYPELSYIYREIRELENLEFFLSILLACALLGSLWRFFQCNSPLSQISRIGYKELDELFLREYSSLKKNRKSLFQRWKNHFFRHFSPSRNFDLRVVKNFSYLVKMADTLLKNNILVNNLSARNIFFDPELKTFYIDLFASERNSKEHFSFSRIYGNEEISNAERKIMSGLGHVLAKLISLDNAIHKNDPCLPAPLFLPDGSLFSPIGDILDRAKTEYDPNMRERGRASELLFQFFNLFYRTDFRCIRKMPFGGLSGFAKKLVEYADREKILRFILPTGRYCIIILISLTFFFSLIYVNLKWKGQKQIISQIYTGQSRKELISLLNNSYEVRLQKNLIDRTILILDILLSPQSVLNKSKELKAIAPVYNVLYHKRKDLSSILNLCDVDGKVKKAAEVHEFESEVGK